MTQPIIYAFVQPGCPACAAFKPKLKKLAGEYKKRGVETKIIDVTDESPEVQGLADRLRVEATPTIVIEGAGLTRKREGDMPVEELRGIYDAAKRPDGGGAGAIVVAAVGAAAFGITALLLLRRKG